MNQNPDIETVLVTGATGDVGGRTLRALLADGVGTVRAMYRHDGQRAGLAALGAEPVQAGFDDPDSLRRAMRGCDALFLLTPPIPGQAELDTRAVDVAAESGIRRVVRISAADSNLRTPVPWAQAHAVADHHLAASGLDWTVLRPTAFLQNFLEQAATITRGFLPQTTRDGQVSWLDTQDLAEVAARVLREPGHTRATYFLTGPEPLSVPQIADRFSAALGRRVRYVHLPGPVYAAVLRLTGQSWFTARGLQAQFAQVVRAHVDLDTTFEVERLLGRPATSADEWIAREIDTFR